MGGRTKAAVTKLKSMLGDQASLGRSPPPECPEEPSVTTPSTRHLPSCSGTMDPWSPGHKVLLDSFRLQTRLPLFICSIREVPSDVNGLPDGEHVQTSGTREQTQGAEPGHREVHTDMFCSLETSAWEGVPLYNSGQMIGTRDEEPHHGKLL